MDEGAFQALHAKYGGLCPECGISLADRDPQGHSLVHFAERIEFDPKHVLAIERQAYLLELARRGA